MIKNIIFDMGDVLIRFDRRYFIERIGITDPADQELLLREVFLTLEWAQLDRGSLTENEAADIMCTRVPERLWDAVRKLTCEWDKPLLPIPGMAELARELKENGYRLYLLSNASRRQKYFWHDIPGSEYFDGRVVSGEELLVKPQPEIFRLLCERYQLTPDECAFIDDSTANAEVAYLCGIHPVVFHGDVSETRRKLAGLGIKVTK